MKVNPVLSMYADQVRGFFENYRNESPRGQWGVILSVLSAIMLVVDFVIFIGFVAVIGASWGVVIILYMDMAENTLGATFSENHYVLMSMVILRLFSIFFLICFEGLVVYDIFDDADVEYFGFKLMEWFVVYTVYLFLYTVYSVATLFYAMRIILLEQRRAQSLPTLM